MGGSLPAAANTSAAAGGAQRDTWQRLRRQPAPPGRLAQSGARGGVGNNAFARLALQAWPPWSLGQHGCALHPCTHTLHNAARERSDGPGPNSLREANKACALGVASGASGTCMHGVVTQQQQHWREACSAPP